MWVPIVDTRSDAYRGAHKLSEGGTRVASKTRKHHGDTIACREVGKESDASDSQDVLKKADAIRHDRSRSGR
jgi:hypothetical protein